MSSITCFGEVLWDVFDTQKTIGGAPLNVALRLNAFGNTVNMISCVGNDADGENILKYITKSGLSTNGIQLTNKFKTGVVKVVLDKTGVATYTIEYPCAWDNIQLNEDLKKTVKNSDAFVFGSLAARDSVSKDTLLELLKIAKFKVFDVNLRYPYYTLETIKELMKMADFIKFNEEELVEICQELNFHSNDIVSNIKFISSATNTSQICVTLGKDGAILFSNNKVYKNKGYTIKVKDTVGAGDSFLATLISKLLENVNLQEALNYACAVATLVVGHTGANPTITQKKLQRFIKM